MPAIRYRVARVFACELARFDFSVFASMACDSFLDVFQVESEAEDSTSRLSHSSLSIAASLRPKAVAPYWHLAAPMRWNFGLPIDFVIDLPKWKLAAVIFCQFP